MRLEPIKKRADFREQLDGRSMGAIDLDQFRGMPSDIMPAQPSIECCASHARIVELLQLAKAAFGSQAKARAGPLRDCMESAKHEVALGE